MVRITRIYSLAFVFIYCLYWLICKAQHIYERIVRLVFYSNNRISKIQETLDSLQKRPKTVVLAIQITPEMIQNNKISKQTLENIFDCIDVIKMGKTQTISVFLWGFDQNFELLVQEQEYKDKIKQLNLIEFGSIFENLNRDAIQWNKKQISLVISLSSYNSLNCLPFTYLIDSEFSFCPSISQCQRSDIQKCFQQYAGSKQRHGR